MTITANKNDLDDGEPYILETMMKSTQRRVGWLGLFLVGLMASALVMSEFESVLARHVELAFFVPLIVGHGGNAGSQTVTSVVRAISLNEIDTNRKSSWWLVIFKECKTGLLCGCLLGMFAYVLTMFLGVSRGVALSLAVALPLVTTWSNFLGAILPIFVSHAGYDPALIAAPLMTTIIDSTGLILYFVVARLLVLEQ